MYILEYVAEWENGESVLNRFKCKTYTEAHSLMNDAKVYTDDLYVGEYPMFPFYNHSFRIEEVN